jgi:two-component system, OmpR family, response regulator
MFYDPQREAADPAETAGKAEAATSSIHEPSFSLPGMSGVLGRLAAASSSHESGCYRFGGWQVDPHRPRLIDPVGATVALTEGEHALLMTFLKAPQQLLPREYLARAVCIHGDSRDPCLDLQILQLRRKLEIDARAPKIIVTQRGAGYIFALEVECP